MTPRGKLIVGVGLPGSGKTTVLSSTAALLDAGVYLEPEEGEWDRAVMERDKYGYIGALHWFRSQRVPNLFNARERADAGQIAFLDTFYDKICVSYLGKPGMEWLLPRSDPYFDNFLDTARLDSELLPDADIVVFFRVTEADWHHMLGSRGRQLDALVELKRTYSTQAYFEEAAREYAARRACQLIEFDNVFSTVDASAALLADVIRGILR